MSSSKTTPMETVTLHKTVKARIDRVFKAWTEPAQMSKWFGGQGVTAIRVSHDFQVGGDYRIEMDHGDQTSHVIGTYKEIVPNTKLVFTWNSDFPEVGAQDSIVSVQFIDKGDSTEIVLNHSKFVAEISAQAHTEGWTYALATLDRVLSEG